MPIKEYGREIWIALASLIAIFIAIFANYEITTEKLVAIVTIVSGILASRTIVKKGVTDGNGN